MILDRKILTIAEAKTYLAPSEEKGQIDDYMKDFGKTDVETAKKMRAELSELNNIKIKEEHIVKIVDFMPIEADEVHKIFNDVSLTEEETNDILSIVKKY